MFCLLLPWRLLTSFSGIEQGQKLGVGVNAEATLPAEEATSPLQPGQHWLVVTGQHIKLIWQL